MLAIVIMACVEESFSLLLFSSPEIDELVKRPYFPL